MFEFIRKLFVRKPTPEDTFNALRGYTYEEVEKALRIEHKKQDYILSFNFYIMLFDTVQDRALDQTIENRNKLLRKYRWKIEDFRNEMFKRLQ